MRQGKPAGAGARAYEQGQRARQAQGPHGALPRALPRGSCSWHSDTGEHACNHTQLHDLPLHTAHAHAPRTLTRFSVSAWRFVPKKAMRSARTGPNSVENSYATACSRRSGWCVGGGNRDPHKAQGRRTAHFRRISARPGHPWPPPPRLGAGGRASHTPTSPHTRAHTPTPTRSSRHTHLLCAAVRGQEPSLHVLQHGKGYPAPKSLHPGASRRVVCGG